MRAADPRLPGIDPPRAVRATAVPEAPTPSLPARSLPCAPLLPLSGLRFSAPACDVPPRQPPSPPRSTTPPRGCPAGADPPRAVRAAAALHAYIAREAATGRGENAAGPWGCWWRSDVVSQQDNRSWALGRASLGAGEGSIRSRSREVKLGRAADVVEGPRPRHQVFVRQCSLSSTEPEL
ncbi:uncharacterized protein LOC120702972 [Panicum virgatum]|uniref:uncharacterized protein LOC120702972 n=1 Tax=Panicum virgatum TaxID=38727 RepID=UPI0019D5B57C|nr:uncharacterized protein LOC120702972 [Panicum virgatum]